MSFEDAIRQIIQEENEKHLQEVKKLLDSYAYPEAPKILTVPEAAEILRIGRTSTYELCQQSAVNGFPCFKEGNKIRIPYTALMNWIDQQSKQLIS